MRIYDLLEGTLEYDQICRLDTVYKQIASEQDEWKSSCSFTCPDGCGTCCEHFEPDVTEAEALYLAAWMLYNQEETAFAIIEGTFVPAREYEDGCILFDAHSPYHCTVYSGRCLICRIFGFTGANFIPSRCQSLWNADNTRRMNLSLCLVPCRLQWVI